MAIDEIWSLVGKKLIWANTDEEGFVTLMFEGMEGIVCEMPSKIAQGEVWAEQYLQQNKRQAKTVLALETVLEAMNIKSESKAVLTSLEQKLASGPAQINTALFTTAGGSHSDQGVPAALNHIDVTLDLSNVTVEVPNGTNAGPSEAGAQTATQPGS